MNPELQNFHGLISTLHMRTVMLHGHAGEDPGEMAVCKDKSLLDPEIVKYLLLVALKSWNVGLLSKDFQHLVHT